jgi:hypothetical protein
MQCRAPFYKPSRSKLAAMEDKVTLCIAATCRDYTEHGSMGPGEPRAVLASDWRVETAAAGAEIEVKDDMLHKRWFSLLAGDVAQARELNELYRGLLRAEEITAANCLEKLRIPLQQFRRRLADSYTQTVYSMTYDEFLKNGKTQLPEDSFRQSVFEIGNQRTEAELILVGFIENEFVLFHCANLDVAEHSHFAAIGSGAQIAMPALFQREQRSSDSLDRTIFAVHEAKKLAEIAPGVGRNTTYTLLSPPKDSASGLEFSFCSETGKRELAKRYRRFGLKKITGDALPHEFWT